MDKKEIQQKLEQVKKNQNLLTLSNHTALHDSVIVVPAIIEEPGIARRSVQFEDRPDVGIVVALGEEVSGMEVGDVVFFGQYSHFQVTHDDITYLIMRAEDIFCVAK